MFGNCENKKGIDFLDSFRLLYCSSLFCIGLRPSQFWWSQGHSQEDGKRSLHLSSWYHPPSILAFYDLVYCSRCYWPSSIVHWTRKDICKYIVILPLFHPLCRFIFVPRRTSSLRSIPRSVFHVHTRDSLDWWVFGLWFQIHTQPSPVAPQAEDSFRGRQPNAHEGHQEPNHQPSSHRSKKNRYFTRCVWFDFCFFRVGTSVTGTLIDPIDLVNALPSNEPIVFVFGAIAHGHINLDYVEETVSFSKFPVCLFPF